MTGDDIRAWFTALSAVIAAVAFVIGLVRHRNDLSARAILSWQRVVIHEIFQKSKIDVLKFEEIRSKYLEEAHSYQGLKIPHTEMATIALRRIIVSMITDRIIKQYDNDRYALDCEDWNIRQEKNRIELRLMKLRSISHEAYLEILDNPFRYNVDALVGKIADAGGYKHSEVRLEVEHMLNMEKIKLDDVGRMGATHRDLKRTKIAAQSQAVGL